MGYDPATGMWKADDDSVANKVTGLLASGNPYIEQAKSQGVDYANSRGLVNSSIAAGASQKAAYDAAVPIATADANITAQKNLSGQGYLQTKDLQTQQIGSQEKIAQLGADTQTKIAGMNIDAAAQQQSRQIIADAAKQATQITSDQALAKLQADTQTNIANLNIDAASKQLLQKIASDELIAARANTTQTAIAGMNIDAAYKQQAADILSREKIAGQQLSTQYDISKMDRASQEGIAKLSAETQSAIAGMNISDADKQQLLQLATQEKLAGLQQSTQLQIADMNVSSNQQDKSQAAATTYAQVYASMVNTINANKDIPADARATYLANAKTLYDNGLNLVQQTYGVQLDWGQGTPANSNAPAGATASITDAYQSLLGRAPDPDGLAYWSNQMASGKSIDQIRAEIQNSDEYKARGAA